MTITNMTSAHVAQIAELEKCCFNDPWSENSISSELNNRLSCWLVALESDVVIGYVGSQTVLGETDMMNIAVHPDYRNQGVAKKLIQNLMDIISEQGSHSLMLEGRQSNEPAKNLYASLGFETVGIRKNYYRNPKENALILRKEWSL